jgi:hypothetical protein
VGGQEFLTQESAALPCFINPENKSQNRTFYLLLSNDQGEYEQPYTYASSERRALSMGERTVDAFCADVVLLLGNTPGLHMKERRSLERFKLRLPSKVEILAVPQGVEKCVLKLFTSNVCSGGAFFPVSKPLRQGTPVKVSLLLDNANLRLPSAPWTLVEVTGAVLRSETSGMVIAFEPNFKIIPHAKTKVLFPFSGLYENRPRG